MESFLDVSFCNYKPISIESDDENNNGSSASLIKYGFLLMRASPNQTVRKASFRQEESKGGREEDLRKLRG